MTQEANGCTRSPSPRATSVRWSLPSGQSRYEMGRSKINLKAGTSDIMSAHINLKSIEMSSQSSKNLKSSASSALTLSNTAGSRRGDS